MSVLLLSMPSGLEWLVIIAAFVIYFVPAFIARKSEKFVQILVVNIFLGWTILGWFGSLIWALLDYYNDKQSNVLEPEIGLRDSEVIQRKIAQIQQAKKLHDAGAMTKEEFESIKSRIMSE